MLDIKSMTPEEIETLIIGMGQPKFRAKQLFKWLHRGVTSFDDMTDMPKEFRAALGEICEIKSAEIVKEYQSALDSTRKYLVKFNDGQHAETVLMEYRHGFSLCVSSQVGCKMGCTFCATGRCGFIRDLTASEMLAQITAVSIHNNIRI
ncbi:MAG: 23S rRNA (adenine(2503)-C(2))-methyltransferase RlmN, partial [Oscillospiraceae bacterium]|nr:23S rRNA (adenine(2503)-C(2))-methyltransferase RlmN [Oscillospiraceae bacterium]